MLSATTRSGTGTGHPRVYGELGLPRITISAEHGSSPRWRGTYCQYRLAPTSVTIQDQEPRPEERGSLMGFEKYSSPRLPSQPPLRTPMRDEGERRQDKNGVFVEKSQFPFCRCKESTEFGIGAQGKTWKDRQGEGKGSEISWSCRGNHQSHLEKVMFHPFSCTKKGRR